jgi:hypothetical protein
VKTTRTVPVSAFDGVDKLAIPKSASAAAQANVRMYFIILKTPCYHFP